MEGKKDVKASTSCPSPKAFYDAYQGADKVIVITLSQKVSGAYNSACVARDMMEHPENVFVFDSYAACGVQELIARRAIEEIKKGSSFEEIQKALEEERASRKILFVLEKFDSLMRTGRVPKVVTTLATKLKIKPVGIAKNGEIHIQEIVRTVGGTLKRFVANIQKFCEDTKGKLCVISHTLNPERAQDLKKIIEEKYEFSDVIIRPNQGISSYYGNLNAIMVSF